MLKNGSSGNAVKDLQTNLVRLGFSVGSPGADGLFGPLTESAVRKFQKAHGLPVDGVVGPSTLSKISELILELDSRAKTSLPPTRPEPVPQVKNLPPLSAFDAFFERAGANPDNLVTIVNTSFNPPRAINFYGLAPDDLTESHSANFEPVEIMGRSSPLASYSGGGGRTVDISLDVHEDYLKAYSNQKNVANIVEFVGQVKALTYPRYQDNIVIPPRVFIKIGEFFRMKAYCNSVSVSWKKPIREGRYIMAGLNMNFTEILSVSFSADEVATGKDLERYFKWPG
jgi:hypothetical protein